MRISNSKKELARIISENGGWRDGAKFTAQDGDGTGSMDFFKSKPQYDKDDKYWKGEYDYQNRIKHVDVTIKNFHQTILSREEYFHLYPAPDADGWIECNGCEPGIDRDAEVEVKFRDGKICHGSNPVRVWCWTHGACDDDIIAYRLHKPEQAKPEFCESVTRSIPEPKPTIEQLAAEYRNRKDYADRKQQEADAAKADAEAKLAELVAAGKALGLVVSVETTESKCPESVMQITKRSQLEIGDVIWIGRSGVKEDERRLPEGEYQVVKVGTIGVLHNGSTFYPDFSFRSWRFIRRP